MRRQTISPQQIQGQPSGSFTLVDVRTPAEFEQVHAQGARLMPMDPLNPDTLRREAGSGEEQAIYLIRRGGCGGRAAYVSDGA